MRFLSFLRAAFPAKAACLLFLLGAVAGCSTTGTLSTVQALRPSGDPSRHAVIVVDGNNGKVLFQANADAARYPASLTKMMTLYMTFEAMDSGRLSKTTHIPVSAYAASRPPTKIGFRAGQTIDVDSAIYALVTKSANDVAVALGEQLGGSEERFAEMMTAKARQIGMRNTVFRNASGLPDDQQMTTARDMAVLGLSLRKRFPQYYRYFSARSFDFNGRTIRGHNDLLGRVQGVDGIKTGYIRASGFNIVTSVSADGRKLVVVVMGGDTARSRNAEVEQLIERYLPSASRGPVPAAAPADSMPAPAPEMALAGAPVRPEMPIE
ncbi:D-alanyl-D-alanine carboxypeptidase [Mesorhizobium soli]|uniref:D-alanyl-D-alanine carboxypeptidase n=1 Tax=Pseudaminobacter soli (ex Li et al. 2025) TaxID=1295366 RepID=A0A2P7SIN4_9HYPH|nr:D-alanyl-D-alanine carboxypeptidase family protein [Mesorhizobium soli]PSJ62362.1 D-alanyl-D-alanine carboxypeptidase [Mesorhizobium soli]